MRSDSTLIRALNEAFFSASLESYLTAQKDAVSLLYMTLAKQAADPQLSQDKQNVLHADLVNLQAKANLIAATLPESDTWHLKHASKESRLAHGRPGY